MESAFVWIPTLILCIGLAATLVIVALKIPTNTPNTKDQNPAHFYKIPMEMLSKKNGRVQNDNP